ncbi:hypothetical protein Scep_022415 [Stephania cephalantha]|uniref:Uncharacterized protein n=1 Tax=Stephania cephalantha TaxID=152367 RepID=A0AAP0I252_9MAGN
MATSGDGDNGGSWIEVIQRKMAAKRKATTVAITQVFARRDDHLLKGCQWRRFWAERKRYNINFLQKSGHLYPGNNDGKELQFEHGCARVRLAAACGEGHTGEGAESGLNRAVLKPFRADRALLYYSNVEENVRVLQHGKDLGEVLIEKIESWLLGHHGENQCWGWTVPLRVCPTQGEEDDDMGHQTINTMVVEQARQSPDSPNGTGTAMERKEIVGSQEAKPAKRGVTAHGCTSTLYVALQHTPLARQNGIMINEHVAIENLKHNPCHVEGKKKEIELGQGQSDNESEYSTDPSMVEVEPQFIHGSLSRRIDSDAQGGLGQVKNVGVRMVATSVQVQGLVEPQCESVIEALRDSESNVPIRVQRDPDCTPTQLIRVDSPEDNQPFLVGRIQGDTQNSLPSPGHSLVLSSEDFVSSELDSDEAELGKDLDLDLDRPEPLRLTDKFDDIVLQVFFGHSNTYDQIKPASGLVAQTPKGGNSGDGNGRMY